MTSQLKKIAAELMKCGVSRVRIQQSKEVAEALTREDIRGLIAKGLITRVPAKGTSRAHAKRRQAQKKQGRRRSEGSRKGSTGARAPAKKAWIRGMRAQRKALRSLRDNEELKPHAYRQVYSRIKGGTFRSKARLSAYLKEAELINAQAKQKK